MTMFCECKLQLFFKNNASNEGNLVFLSVILLLQAERKAYYLLALLEIWVDSHTHGLMVFGFKEDLNNVSARFCPRGLSPVKKTC